ncbi:MAG TPA: aldo/keto reductase, partial [Clostridia bacterium]
MLYRQMGKSGDKVSVLGYGCMRFPKRNIKIDEERTKKQILYAIEQGINYFDTAYLYPNSESTLGKILAGTGYRDKVLIASKMPPIMIHS